MNASRILAEAGVDLDELRAELHPVEPATINVWPAARFIRILWRPGVRGVTLWRLVLVDPEVMRGDRRSLARLVLHELVHVRQFRHEGYLAFTIRYLREYWSGRLRGLGHREAYREIAAEREAREVAERYTVV